ncbi:VOC family protein [Actinosynnema sp. NPDC050436]|uniref:VOC family protein n=1 Tax=Actinosynnema sp. NPDC050436 TaxID=3155659 RepID=UPI0033E24EAC
MIDHLVYATPDLEGSIGELRDRFGVALVPGGRHAGMGTRNYLGGLGGGAYLEVIGPDPDQPDPERPRPFGLDALTGPRLVAWAARVHDLDTAVDRARAHGVDPGRATAMTRTRPDGVRLAWRLALPPDLLEFGGPAPFLIDWGSSPHPAADAEVGLRLVSFEGAHPDPAEARRRLVALGVEGDLPVGEAAAPGLRAVIDGPAGPVELT